VSVALDIQQAMRMRHIVVCWSARIYSIFSHYHTNSTIFAKKVTEHKMCDFFLQRVYETHLIITIIKRDMIKKVHWPSCKVTVILVRF